MTNTQCLSCKLTGIPAERLAEWIDEGLGRNAISDRLYDTFGISISASSIKRHKRDHHKPQETLLGVVAPPVVDEGVRTVEMPESGLLADPDELLRGQGIDPTVFEIVGPITKGERTGDGENSSLRFRFQPKESAGRDKIDLPALYASARLATPKPKPQPKKRGTCVVYADPQLGKTGRRGGTKETIERSMIIREKLDALLTKRAPSQVALLDAGDGIEGFNSGGNPMFTNDLSLPDQLDVYATELFEFTNLCHKHAPTDVLGVPSNHAAWRNGKQQLGRPQDDFGLFVHRQVKKVTEMTKMDVTWTEPLAYDESVVLDVLGTKIGLVHGHQFSPGKAIDWWQKQTFGAGAITMADIMVYGHYHTFTAGVAGRNPHTQRQRWCFGAPTLDNGSDWFRQIAGVDSDPGMLVFDVTENGFDLSSLVILDTE